MTTSETSSAATFGDLIALIERHVTELRERSPLSEPTDPYVLNHLTHLLTNAQSSSSWHEVKNSLGVLRRFAVESLDSGTENHQRVEEILKMSEQLRTQEKDKSRSRPGAA
jgi:hypothetical protein